jgi:Na+/H+-dicarboxylate symporter
MKLWQQILIGMVLGVVTGLFLGPDAEFLKPIGTIFINLISMVTLPLMVTSLIVGIASTEDPKKLGRIGLKTLIPFFLSTIFAIMFGLGFGLLFEPGTHLNFDLPATHVATTEAPGLKKIFISIFPSNFFNALSTGNIMQALMFAGLFGVALTIAGEKGKPVFVIAESIAQVMYSLTSIIMKLSPLGVFGIMASVAGTFGVKVLLPLLVFLGSYYLACAVHVMIVFCGILWGLARLHPLPFFRGIRDAILFALSTCSSSATLPTAMRCAEENLGVSRHIINFVFPLGITLNMNGTAIFQAMSTVFIAQAYGIPIDLHLVLIVLVATIMSAIATAGIPGSGFIMLSAVVSAAGLPIEGIAILAGVDRLREMVSTSLNIVGDAVIAVYVAKSEGELDEKRYYSTEPLPAPVSTESAKA